RGHWLEHGFFHRQVRQVRGCDQRLMVLNGGGYQMHVGLKARANAPGRLAEPGASIENEILRSHVQNHAVTLERHVRAEFHGVCQVVRINLAWTAELVESPSMRAVNFFSADSEGRRFH